MFLGHTIFLSEASTMRACAAELLRNNEHRALNLLLILFLKKLDRRAFPTSKRSKYGAYRDISPFLYFSKKFPTALLSFNRNASTKEASMTNLELSAIVDQLYNLLCSNRFFYLFSNFSYTIDCFSAFFENIILSFKIHGENSLSNQRPY